LRIIGLKVLLNLNCEIKIVLPSSSLRLFQTWACINHGSSAIKKASANVLAFTREFLFAKAVIELAALVYTFTVFNNTVNKCLSRLFASFIR